LRGSILQINVSRGGLPKRPIPGAMLTPLGFEGDSVAHPAIHGGPDKAVLLITAETTDELIARGYPLFYGALGENLTTRGLDRRDLRSGLRFRVGEAVIELTRLRRPCGALDIYGPRLKTEIFHEGLTAAAPEWATSGFYASVVQPGWVHSGAIICVVDAAV
jgi:MOSC domain-containing protein YiiM